MQPAGRHFRADQREADPVVVRAMKSPMVFQPQVGPLNTLLTCKLQMISMSSVALNHWKSFDATLTSETSRDNIFN